MLCTDAGNIVTTFLSPNVTAVRTTDGSNPIIIVKLNYRSKFLFKIVAEEDVPIDQLLKNHSLNDAILFLKSAWDVLPRSILQNAWSKLLNCDYVEYDDEDNLPLSVLMSLSNAHEKQSFIFHFAHVTEF